MTNANSEGMAATMSFTITPKNYTQKQYLSPSEIKFRIQI